MKSLKGEAIARAVGKWRTKGIEGSVCDGMRGHQAPGMPGAGMKWIPPPSQERGLTIRETGITARASPAPRSAAERRQVEVLVIKLPYLVRTYFFL